MIRLSAAARVCGVLIGLATLAGCADNAPPAPANRVSIMDLAQSDAALDADCGAIDDLRLSRQ